MVRRVAQSARFRHFLRIHALPFLFFLALTIVLSWPSITTFTSAYIGDSTEDPRHNIWHVWHVKEALLGRVPIYQAPNLYYPEGISLHLHGIGPLIGVLALPFWPLGLTAAYNGAILLAFALSSYAIYLLVRQVGLSQLAALFTGTFYAFVPMHLAGFFGHLEKTFTALLPLALLAVLFFVDLRRSRRWAVFPAVVLFLTLLFNGLLFIEAVISAVILTIIVYLRSNKSDRPELNRRIVICAVAVVLLCAPLLIATVQASAHPNIRVDLNFASADYQPDLIQFIIPPSFGLLFGHQAENLLQVFDITSQIEKNVYLSWIGLFLMTFALVKKWRLALPWLLLTVFWAVLALGPTLQILGERTHTEYDLPITMPYVFFTMLPGLDFLRTPGRLFLMGAVTFSVMAGLGLQFLHEKWPARRWVVTLMLTIFIFVEGWPQPWPAQTLRTPPPFYRSIAEDTAEYGVLDLPFQPPEAASFATYSSRYQIDQLTHRKGIVGGYISRPYQNHPLFPCLIPSLRSPQPDVQVNGRPTDCTVNILHDLAYFNYRYVVWHKPQPGNSYASNPAEVEESSAYLLNLLGNQQPLVDDEMTTVYTVPLITAESQITTTIALLNNWYSREGETRWAKSPASLLVSVPGGGTFDLTIIPADIYDPGPGQSVGQEGTLEVLVDEELITEVQIQKDQPLYIPLSFSGGVHRITLSLKAGNFRPIDVGGGEDRRWLGFAIRSINLESTSMKE